MNLCTAIVLTSNQGAALGGRARSRHQLSTLLTEAYQNRESLEEKIAQGRRNRKEAGNKYGESNRLSFTFGCPHGLTPRLLNLASPRPTTSATCIYYFTLTISTICSSIQAIYSGQHATY